MREVIKYLFILFFLGFTLKIYSQTSSKGSKNQIGISHDNDFLLTTDWYYTFGLFLNYSHFFEKGIFKNTHEQLSLKLGQQAYTPSNIETSSILEMDRPYAGFLSLETSWSIATISSQYQIRILTGVVGPTSGVGQFQQWYHDHIVKYKTPSWANELPNRFHTNLILGYVREWEWTPNPFSIHVAITPLAVIGSKDQFFQPQITTFFGRRSSLQQSMAYNQIGGLERELYFSLQFGYKWIAKNAFLERNTIEKEIFLFNFNFHHRYLSHEYRVGYHYNTKEASNLERHQYISLSYAKNF